MKPGDRIRIIDQTSPLYGDTGKLVRPSVGMGWILKMDRPGPEGFARERQMVLAAIDKRGGK